jgi:hypothetical protein
MAMKLSHVVALLLVSAGTAATVTPVEKVIALLDGMKTDIETEGKSEGATYEKQACFCKDTTAKKSTSITTGQDTIDKLSAAIADNTAIKQADETKLQGLKDLNEKLNKDLEDSTARCATEKAEYEALAADFNKAISSLKSAIKSMSDGGGKAASSFLEVKSDLKETLDLAEAMGLTPAPKKGSIAGLLQQGASVDPSDPDYKYHSQDIVDLLLSLKKDFTAEKSSLDMEWGKTEQSCTSTKKSLAAKIKTNGEERASVTGKLTKNGSTIADDRGKLVEAQSSMQDDEQYLKELTNTCENDATKFDQRSTMRAGEIEALSTALSVLSNKVKGADTAVNKRAFVQQPDKNATKKVEETKKVVASTKKVEEPKKVISFLQRTVVNVHNNEAAQEQIMKDQVLTLLHAEGVRLSSPVLTVLSMKIAADPFKKVKNLIQGLIERLITESAAEATKKGFCDTELGKARYDRTFRWTQVKKLTAQITVLQAKSDAYTEEIAELTAALEVLGKAVVESTKLRKEQKADNTASLTTAREGLAAVNEALLLLRSFYKSAAKSEGEGEYKGKQESSNAVLGLLETISSDFDRTIRSTESDEESAAAAYVKFQRASKVDWMGKTTQKDLDTQDLETTNTKIKVKSADHKTNMDLVDDAVRALMELKPTCVDSGMSYSERVEKREEEVKALGKALCILDTEKVESECGGKSL